VYSILDVAHKPKCEKQNLKLICQILKSEGDPSNENPFCFLTFGFEKGVEHKISPHLNYLTTNPLHKNFFNIFFW
jgi:hypothetical protein